MASKTVFILGVCIWVFAALAAVAVARPEDAPYTTQYDNFDIDKVLANKRLLENYFKCLVDRGPCTKESTELKQILPDALQTKCSKCSEKQKAAAEKIAKHISEKEPAMWTEVKAKYDPEGKWEARYAEEARQRGIAV